jgi:hypothetical protein
MLAVLDTNVIISALLSSAGAPARIMEKWEEGVFDAAVSEPLLEELERALGYDRIKPYLERSGVEVKDLIRKLRETALVVDPERTLHVIKEDPEDDRVLECALRAGAAYIVSGDHHLLDLGEYRGVQILPPAGFLLLLE